MTSPAHAIDQSELFNAPKSQELSVAIEKLIPGGVDSPFRSFKDVGGHTIFFSRGEGSKLYDLDGNTYIDFLGAWGPAILGYCHPVIVEACRAAIASGPVFGAPHVNELRLAQLLTEAVPSLEMVRFVNSGTEAVMSAIRLARGFTGRERIVMFEGCYHGHSDSVLASRGHSSSAGVPTGISNNTLLVPFNDFVALQQCVEEHRDQIAAVVIEPIAGSMGVVPPGEGYLRAVSDLSTASGIVLIFDEVLTGIRVARGGAQSLYDLKPDLTCFGKALGGGMAIGAYGGRRQIMEHLEPIGKVYQAGTFSGNPVTMAGGIATLELLSDAALYQHLETVSSRLFEGLRPEINRNGWPVQLQRVGSMFSIILAEKPVTNYRESMQIDSARFAALYHELLRSGIYLPPSAVDAAAISCAHSAEDIDRSVEKMLAAMRKVFSRKVG